MRVDTAEACFFFLHFTLSVSIKVHNFLHPVFFFSRGNRECVFERDKDN